MYLDKTYGAFTYLVKTMYSGLGGVIINPNSLGSAHMDTLTDGYFYQQTMICVLWSEI